MSALRALLTVCAVLGCALSAEADQTDPRLEGLFADLKEASAVAEALPIEQRIWAIWLETENAAAAGLMESGVEAMERGDYETALPIFDELVEIAPDFAEGWNKRATLHYVLENFAQSLEDIDRTLQLEPHHFGALSGQGLVEPGRALQSFEAALSVHPQMPGARINARALRRLLDQRDI